MKTPQEILANKRHNQENIDKVSAFLETNYFGNSVKYEGKLTEVDIAFINNNGWKVVQKDNGADKWGYASWFEISSLI